MRPLKSETLDPPQSHPNRQSHPKHHRRGRLWQAATLAAALSTAPFVTVHLPAALQSRPAPHPVRSTQHQLTLTRTTLAAVQQAGPSRPVAPGQADPAATARAAAITPPQDVKDGVAVVGVTWPAASDVSATDQFQVRTLTGSVWSAWQTLDRDASHSPDTAGSAGSEGRQAERGTQPYVVTGASRVEVRALSSDGSTPTTARVQVIDPGTSSADASVDAPAGGVAAAAAGRPTIYTRAQWGADESLRKGTPDYGQTQVAYVHHTDSANNYTADQVPGIIRGIYAYHVKGEGWNDIGYNFLVDRFGRIWEGRYGGMDKAVVGAHTLGYNSWSFGVSAIGNFVSTAPSSATVGAIERVIAWKLSIAGVPATGTVYAKDKWFNRISGHRDAFQTTCPGAYLYARLPSIRSAVASLEGSLHRATLSHDVTRSGGADLVSYAAGGPVSMLPAASPGPVNGGTRLGTGWNALRNISLTPDLSGDGHADVLAQDPGKGTLRVYTGTGTGAIAGMIVGGSGWNGINRLIPAGDRDGDGLNDFYGTTPSGQLILYSGNGRGWILRKTVVGVDWQGISSIVPVNDLDGDGIEDVYAVRSSDGALFSFSGRPDGALTNKVQRGSGWGGLSPVIGGDLDGDGQPDLLGRYSSGTMRTFYGTGGARFGRNQLWGSGWAPLTNLSTGVDFNGDGRLDVLAVNAPASGGTLLMYSGTGRRDYSAGPVVQSLPVGTDLVRVVGDVDGDGHADAIARARATDQLLFLRGQSGTRFAAPVVIGAGWNQFTTIEAAGDLNYDGVPDLMARTSTGDLWLYPMNRSHGFGTRMKLGTGWSSMLSFTGVGTFNSDGNADVVALRASDHALLLYRGSGPTPLLDATVLAGNQSDLAQVVGSGDYNGDGNADLVARSTSGALWLYTGNGAGGLTGSRQPLRGGEGSTHVIG